MKRKNWLNDARFTSWWLDFPDLGWPNPQLTEKWRRRAETFQNLQVNAVIFQGFHLRWDYLGILNRVLGALREITEICHDHGIKVVEFHSATSVHRIQSTQDRHLIQKQNHHQTPFYPDSWTDIPFSGKEMPSWRQISARNGKPLFDSDNATECFCPNHPGFQKAYHRLIERHLEEVPFDAFMSDELRFVPDFYSCACQHCQKRFTDETGHQLPPPDDTRFWENRENPAFAAWISSRYRWNADHFRRLRKQLPAEIPLWGNAHCSLSSDLAKSGSSPQLFAEHFNAIFHAIPAHYLPAADHADITAGIAGFQALARYHKKPLILRAELNSSDDLPAWSKLIHDQNARPWFSRQSGNPNAAQEEELLKNNFQFSATTSKPALNESIQGVVFSEIYRDRLKPADAMEYVQTCRELCGNLTARGNQLFLLFDTMWNGSLPALWECLWILDPDALDESKTRKIKEWQQRGLAIGLS